MISGLCGFAELVRHRGGEVGAAELIDVARAFRLVDLADPHAVEQVMRMGLSWAASDPNAFDDLFRQWFTGAELELVEPGSPPVDPTPLIELDVETIDAARIHTEDGLVVGDDRDEPDAATADDGVESPSPAPTQAAGEGGVPVGAHGQRATRPASHDESADLATGAHDLVVELPEAPPAADLELARGSLASALERRRLAMDRPPVSNRVTALTVPLTRDERAELARSVRQVKRALDGAPSWRRAPAPTGAIDMRRTLRRMVTTGGVPADVHTVGPRRDAARLIVLVDVSLSVRGTSRLVLHLLHRVQASVGSLRTFGFVDRLVPIDRALRTGDAVDAIERVLEAVDVQATSDPGRAFRAWWSRWHFLVTPETSVMILSDGRCNGYDPAFETVRKISARSATTLWVSPEPPGAWRLGRGEMADYASCVDQAVTVRTIDDLGEFAGALTPGTRRSGGRR